MSEGEAARSSEIDAVRQTVAAFVAAGADESVQLADLLELVIACVDGAEP